MNKKIAIRTAIGMVAIVAMFLGYKWFENYSIDPEEGKTYVTGGYIAALENTDQGTKAVVFTPGGEKIDAVGFAEGKEDRELSWSPDGNHIYVSSNRESEAFNIYRWTPTANKFEKRSIGERSQNAPTFGPSSHPDLSKDGLVVSGGQVFQYVPRMKRNQQMLPPISSSGIVDEESGRQSSMSLYEKIGTSFKTAYWGADRRVIYTVMAREDGTEAFVVNFMEPDEQGRLIPPMALLAGDQIQLQVGSEGDALVAVRNFQFPDPEKVDPEFIKNGEVVPPFKHGVLMVSMGSSPQPMVAPVVTFPDDTRMFWDISIAPNGEEFAAIIGAANGQDFIPEGLFIVQRRPMTPEAPPTAVGIMQGLLSKPQWSADGSKFVILKDEEDGRRAVYTMGKDGSSLTRLSKEGVDFESAFFSPQTLGN